MCERQSTGPRLPYDGVGKGEKLPLWSSRPVVGRRAVSEVTRVRELALPLTNCGSRHSGLYTSTRQHNRAGPGGQGGQADPEGMRAGESDAPLAAYYVG